MHLIVMFKDISGVEYALSIILYLDEDLSVTKVPVPRVSISYIVFIVGLTVSNILVQMRICLFSRRDGCLTWSNLQ